VAPSRPEISGTDKSRYLPGEIVHVFGRNFGVTPTVRLSGIPVTSTVLTSVHLTFIAPVRFNNPTNLFVLEVQGPGGISRIAGIEILAGSSVASVPALSTWGMAMLLTVLLVAGIWMIRRRQKLQSA
jgi:hypothetical protein